MKWAVVGKGDIPHVREEADRLIAYLEKQGEDVQQEHGLDEDGKGVAELHNDVDVFLAVGGDGTILYTQQGTNKPVFGVNAGAIGFLAEVEQDGATAGIDRILAGDYRIQDRHKLAATLDGKPLADAVNEVTLQTSRIAKLIRFTVEVDGEELDTYRGDGLIISTPTGSTGYAMSVGGPLVHPRVNGTVLAPIAPFKLASRPWVVPADACIRATLLERDSAQGIQQARVVVDGQYGHDMATGAVLETRESDEKARFIRLGGGFYERVRTKLTR